MPRVSRNKLYMGNSVRSEHFSSDLKGSGIKVTLKVKNKNKKIIKKLIRYSIKDNVSDPF